jgi:hypothetical protein
MNKRCAGRPKDGRQEEGKIGRQEKKKGEGKKVRRKT